MKRIAVLPHPAVSVHDGGDHLIQVGEVDDFQRFGGEPLIFHSGRYRVITKHPQFPEEAGHQRRISRRE